MRGPARSASTESDPMLKTSVRPLLSLLILAAATTLASSPALAAEWTGKGEAGLVLANGNTNTKNANAKLEVSTTLEKWKHTVGLAGIYAQDEDDDTGEEETTAQRWQIYEQSDYNFNEKTFWFGAGRYEDDRFTGFDYQATLSTGLGRHFIDNDTTKLTGTAGVGYKFFETRDTYDETGPVPLLVAEGESDNEAVFRGTLDFSHALTDTTKLLDKFLVESGAENTFIQNDIGIQVKMTDKLALAAAYTVRYNSDPPPGFGSTDTLTTLNLVYEVK